MSVIPFEPGAISAFYEQTMTAYKLKNMGTIHEGKLAMDLNKGKKRCQELYSALLNVFQSKEDSRITTVKYADNISSLPLRIQHVAFVLRAELVYQLLLVVNLTLADSLNHAQGRAFKSIEWSARPYHLNNTNCRRVRRKRPL